MGAVEVLRDKVINEAGIVPGGAIQQVTVEYVSASRKQQPTGFVVRIRLESDADAPAIVRDIKTRLTDAGLKYTNITEIEKVKPESGRWGADNEWKPSIVMYRTISFWLDYDPGADAEFESYRIFIKPSEDEQ